MAASLRTVISPGRYVQGKGAIHQLGEYLKPIGSSPLLVADDLVWGLVGHDIEASLKNTGLPAQREVFHGIPERERGRPHRRSDQAGRRRRRCRRRRRKRDRHGEGRGTPGRHPLGELSDGGLNGRPVQRLVGYLHGGGRVRGVPLLPAKPRPGARRLTGRRQRPGRTAHRGRRGRAGHLARGAGDGAVELEDDGRWSANGHRHGAGPAELGCLVGQRAAGGRRGPRPRGHARGRKGDRGEHAAVRSGIRIGWTGRGACHPQRPHRGRGDARARARAEGEYRVRHPARARGRPRRRDPRLHRVHDEGRAADDADRSRPAAPRTWTACARWQTPPRSLARPSTRCRSR